MSSILLVIVLLGSISTLTLASECTIEGLPEKVPKNGNVYTLAITEPSMTLNLTCKCSLFGPQWHLQQLGALGRQPQFYTNPVHCVNNTGPCSNNTNYISHVNKSHGLYVYLRRSFLITETTTLMCFSNVFRQVLVVSVLEKEDQQLPKTTTVTPVSIIPSTTTTTTTSTSIMTTYDSTQTTTSSDPSPTPIISTVTVTSTVLLPTSTCSSTNNGHSSSSSSSFPIPSVHIEDAASINGVINSVGGPSTVALVPVVIILIIISLTLCGLLLCTIKSRRNERQLRMTSQDYDERRRDSTISGGGVTSMDRLLSQHYMQQMKQQKNSTNPQRKRSDTTNPMWTEQDGNHSAIHQLNINNYTTTNRTDSFESDV